jgi:hypothetical protein
LPVARDDRAWFAGQRPLNYGGRSEQILCRGDDLRPSFAEKSRNFAVGELRVIADKSLTTAEAAAVGAGARARNFGLYIPYSTPVTELFWVKAYCGDSLVGAVGVVRLVKRKATDMLRAPLRRWLGPILGPLARKTTLLVDTAFMGYDDRSPFFTAPGADRLAVKRAISAFLKTQKKVDTVWISEPAADAEWAAAEKYHQFHTLPMVHLVTAGCETIDQYLATLSRNRRRNFKRERDTFAKAGARIRTHIGPVGERQELLRQVLGCLGASATHTQFNVPYNDVLTDQQAFAEQWQLVLTAHLGEQVIGFMSCMQDGDRLMQLHGGLDYAKSHEVLAYHNLIAAAIEHAIATRSSVMSLGPMTNETKRRAGGQMRPIVSSLWNRLPGDAFVAKKLFAKNFEVYRGEIGADDPDRDERDAG